MTSNCILVLCVPNSSPMPICKVDEVSDIQQHKTNIFKIILMANQYQMSISKAISYRLLSNYINTLASEMGNEQYFDNLLSDTNFKNFRDLVMRRSIIEQSSIVSITEQELNDLCTLKVYHDSNPATDTQNNLGSSK